MIDRHFLPLYLRPSGLLRILPLCTSSVVAISIYSFHSLPLFVRRPFGKSRRSVLSAARPGRQHVVLHESALLFGSPKFRLRACRSHPYRPPTACLVPTRAWAVVDLHQTRSTTNLHGPLNPPKNLQCFRRPPARRSHLTLPAGSLEQASSLTLHEQSRPPPPNLPSITHLHPQNTSTSPPPHPALTTRRHTAMTQQTPAPVHLGILNPNRPSQRHQRVHLISSLRPCHQTLPSLCHTLVGHPRSARPQILPFESHPRPGTKIGTRMPIEAVNGTSRLIPTPGRPLRNSAEIPMIHGTRSITLQPSVETSKSGPMKMAHYRNLPAIGAISQKTMQ
jgi:hypothetical protein